MKSLCLFLVVIVSVFDWMVIVELWLLMVLLCV